MIEERTVISGVVTSTLLALTEMYHKMIPFLILGIILIIIDLRFGIDAARIRGEKIRISRALRRSINKLIDYICWITLAGIFGHTYGEILGIPILAAIILLIIYGIELGSCFNNYFEARGVNKRINIFKLLKPEISNALEDLPENKENEKI